MTYVKINGISFDVDVAISSIEETFNVLDGENTWRVMSGRMVRDIIGTYIGHIESKSDIDFMFQLKQPLEVYNNENLIGVYYIDGSRRNGKSYYERCSYAF